jgi:transcriptional regulator with XRE-family HTH domain
MARTALGWGVRDLAKHSHVGASTVARFESGKATNTSTLVLIRNAFEAAGVRFLEDGGIVPPKKNGE